VLDRKLNPPVEYDKGWSRAEPAAPFVENVEGDLITVEHDKIPTRNPNPLNVSCRVLDVRRLEKSDNLTVYLSSLVKIILNTETGAGDKIP
jgi:hypothetical protein